MRFQTFWKIQHLRWRLREARKNPAGSGRNRALPGFGHQAGLLFILGMGRSGTSCLAGCLERSGLHLGEVSRQNQFNPKGNHELKTAIALHDRILKDSGGSWDEPPARVTVSQVRRREMDRLAEYLCQKKPCGLKDPRILLFLEDWLAVALARAGGYAMVGTFRHPRATASSLERRDRFGEEKSFHLWRRYNQELIFWHQLAGFPLVEFDLSRPDLYLETVSMVARQLGLRPESNILAEFISSELDHRLPDGGPMPPSCQREYEYLQEHCVKGEP